MSTLTFDCIAVNIERFSLAPNLLFRLRIHAEDPASVHLVALTTQIRVEPRGRAYSDAEAERLHDLFGERSRWDIHALTRYKTTHALPTWNHVMEKLLTGNLAPGAGAAQP